MFPAILVFHWLVFCLLWRLSLQLNRGGANTSRQIKTEKMDTAEKGNQQFGQTPSWPVMSLLSFHFPSVSYLEITLKYTQKSSNLPKAFMLDQPGIRMVVCSSAHTDGA